MLKKVKEIAQEFLEQTKQKPVRIISKLDTDGITSASILIRTLQRLDKKFTLRIIKELEEETIKEELQRQPKEVIILTGLGLRNLEQLQQLKAPLYILDHHEINKNTTNNNLRILNPHLTENPEENNCTSAGITYLFSKNLTANTTDLAALAVVGLIGEKQETETSKINQSILQECQELTIKKGLIIYPATRPLKRTLESSILPYIPGITGNPQGVAELLKETKIPETKTLLELNEEEMSKLITAIIVKRAKNKNVEELIGNLYLLKFINRKEDVREIAVLINACSRLGYADVALSYCLGSEKAKMQALDIYNEYRQELVSGLRIAEQTNTIGGKGFVILNAKDQIKEAIVGTICSMLSNSPTYEEGTILIGMAYNKDKIKVSARIVGKKGKNLKELLERTINVFRTENPNSAVEFGGHEKEAGCTFEKNKEKEFIEILKKNLEVELIRI